MPAAPDRVHYSNVAIWLHWSIALLIALAAGLALFRETFSPVASEMISAHKVFGLIILALSFVRLGWRLAHKPPPFLPSVSRTERWAANLVHALLYIFMIGVPLAGWIFTSAAPVDSKVDYAGWNTVPRLPLERSRSVSWFWHEVHEIMGFAMIGLFLLHIAGALKQHLFDGQQQLGRMIPWPRRREP